MDARTDRGPLVAGFQGLLPHSLGTIAVCSRAFRVSGLYFYFSTTVTSVRLWVSYGRYQEGGGIPRTPCLVYLLWRAGDHLSSELQSLFLCPVFSIRPSPQQAHGKCIEWMSNCTLTLKAWATQMTQARGVWVTRPKQLSWLWSSKPVPSSGNRMWAPYVILNFLVATF